MVKAFGGISIVNAVPAGLGAVMAINLPVEVKVWECQRSEVKSMDDTFVSAILVEARKTFGLSLLCAEVRSSIPLGSGLKSNSAVAAAIMLEAARLAGIRDRTGAAIAAARATLRLGSSITGALDDASASLLGGITLTNNFEMRVLRRDEAPRVSVVIHVPPTAKRVSVPRLRLLRRFHESLFELAWGKRYWAAMLMNGLAVDAALGYGFSRLVGAALSMGAVSAGVTGNGPAVAAVFRDSPREYINWLSELNGLTLLVEPVNEVDEA